MPDDPLAALLAAAGAAPEHVGPEEIRALGALVASRSFEDFIMYPAHAPGLLNDQDRPYDFFEIHDREWWIDARPPAARDYLTLLIAAAAVSDALVLDYTLLWLTKVLPAVLTVENVTVHADGVRLTLRVRSSPQLSADLSDDVHPQDFADFTAALHSAANVMPLPAGGTVTFIQG
jgi:hypothetical protein